MPLPSGYQTPPIAKPAPTGYQVAWLATLPALATLTADERARVTLIRDGSTDPRVTSRADQLLNGTAFA